MSTKTKFSDAKAVSDFVDRVANHHELQGKRLYRVYFYDAAPLDTQEKIPLGGGLMNFELSALAARNRAMHVELSRKPFFAIR